MMAHVKRPGDNYPDWQIGYCILLRPNQAPLVFRDEEEANYFINARYYMDESPAFSLLQVKHTYEDLCSLGALWHRGERLCPPLAEVAACLAEYAERKAVESDHFVGFNNMIGGIE